MKVWKKIAEELKENNRIVLMVVLESKGSSPGRQGFKMMVSSSGELFGSIGGGFMEHKLVELCKKELLQKEFAPFKKRQVHKDSIAHDKSGMICSGEQTIAFYSLTNKDALLIEQIISSNTGIVDYEVDAVCFSADESLSSRYYLQLNDEVWSLKEDLSVHDELHIVGGGHVGLALSKIGHLLNFKIFTYDNRKNLNTVEQNEVAKHIYIENYEDIGSILTDGSNKYVVLMSFGFRTDKVVLQNLLNHQFKYIGMMGSKEKVERLFEEMINEGATKEQLAKVHSPIGIQINSQTPEEIAVSILAELIHEKTKILTNN
ncbi:MAG TPA: XdhC/CoxI family protein [Crocinitomicaceae bacterium]|nr:XdhC/CoxI family protein [Crocinitomicaceae bacterium]